jgi:hypothetical protein
MIFEAFMGVCLWTMTVVLFPPTGNGMMIVERM